MERTVTDLLTSTWLLQPCVLTCFDNITDGLLPCKLKYGKGGEFDADLTVAMLF